MGNKLRQVLRTYAVRPLFWVMALWVLMHGFIVFAAVMVSSLPDAERLGTIMMQALWGTFLLDAVVAYLLKVQFADPRARLVPGFASPHLIVAGVIVAAAVAASTWTVAWAGGVSGLAVAGFVLCATAAVVYLSYLTPLALSILVMMLAFCPLFKGERYIGALLVDGNPVISLAELCVGLASLAVLGARLSMLHEEMPEYSRQTPASTWGLTSRAGRRNWPQGAARTMARSGLRSWLGDLAFRLVFRWLPGWAPLPRLLLRQLSGGFYALLLVALQFAYVVFLVWLQRSTPRTFDPGSLFFLSLFPVVIATILLYGYLWGRWPYLPRESLYPLSRTDLVGDLFRSSACDMAAVAAGHCAGFLVGLALFRPEGPLVARMPAYLAMTLGQYAVAYCVILWLASFHRRWVGGLGLFALGILSAFLVAPALYSADWLSSPANVALAVTAVVAAVLVLYRLAFRRWCRVEMG
jgi:hypothetical protein